MKKLGLGLAAVVALVGLVAGGTLTWAKSKTAERLSKKYEVPAHDFPIPFPLSPAEVDGLRAERLAALGGDAGVDADGGLVDVLAGVDLEAVAKDRAAARGKHLAEARYGCLECHGKDFAGGVMIDAPPMAVLKGKNLTGGKGGLAPTYTATDWDRIVRHGVKPDGTGAMMPSDDYELMSDRELSDLVSYVRSMPAVDATMPAPAFGPVGYMLMATHKLRLSADQLAAKATHLVEPPEESSPEFGKHLIAVCTGCHNPELSGGPVAGGDPSWPPALNLTPHADGLAGWSYEDFVKVMREGKRRNGQELRPPMKSVATFAQKNTEQELKAMWAYLQSIPAKPNPK